MPAIVETKTLIHYLDHFKLYGLTVKTEYFQQAKLFVERVQIPRGAD